MAHTPDPQLVLDSGDSSLFDDRSGDSDTGIDSCERQRVPTPMAWTALSEQFGVAASAHEYQFLLGQAVEQDPVGLHVAIPMTGPIAAQRVRTAARRERLPVLQKIDNQLQFVEVFALPLGTA